MRRIDCDLYARQNDTHTELVLHVEGDPPIVIASYARELAAKASKVTLLAVEGPGEHDGAYTGIHVTFEKEKA